MSETMKRHGIDTYKCMLMCVDVYAIVICRGIVDGGGGGWDKAECRMTLCSIFLGVVVVGR